MEEPRVYYAECNKSDRERQMPDEFTCMWNLKDKINKHNRNRFIHTENILTVARWEQGWGKGEGIMKYNVVVIEWSWYESIP